MAGYLLMCHCDRLEGSRLSFRCRQEECGEALIYLMEGDLVDHHDQWGDCIHNKLIGEFAKGRFVCDVNGQVKRDQ